MEFEPKSSKYNIEFQRTLGHSLIQDEKIYSINHIQEQENQQNMKNEKKLYPTSIKVGYEINTFLINLEGLIIIICCGEIVHSFSFFCYQSQEPHKNQLMNCRNGTLSMALLKNRFLTSRSRMNKYLLHESQKFAFSETSVKDMYHDGSFLSEYLDFHYGPENYFNIPNFSETCAQLSVEACREENIPLNSALDAGCSVGRYSFELAKLGFQDVLGVDNSERFLRIAQKLQKRGNLKYPRTKEGEIVELKEIDFEKMGLFESKERVRFTHGDMNTYCEDNNQKNFDLVFAGNVICRMQDPKRFLGNVHNVMKPEAFLIITSTYSWMKAFTPRDHWVGGYLKDGKEFLGYQGLQETLQKSFIEIKKPKNINFIIRQNEREFIHSIAEMTFWKKLGN